MDNIERTHFLLRIPHNNEKREDVMSAFLGQIAEILKGEQITLSLEIAIYGKFLYFFLTCPHKYKEVIRGQWYAQYPQAEIEEIKDPLDKMFPHNDLAYLSGYELHYENSEYVPFKTFKEIEKNPLVSLSGIISSLGTTDTALLQLILYPPAKESLWSKFLKSRRKASRVQNAKLYPTKPPQIVLEEAKEEMPYFKTSFRIIMMSKDREKIKPHILSMVVMYTKGLQRFDSQKLKEHKLRENTLLERVRGRALGEKKVRFSTDEIATIFHLPYNQEEISQAMQMHSKRAPPPQNLPSEKSITHFGETTFQNRKSSFGIKNPDRRRHLYVIGKTGMGKSKLLELLISQDILAGQGVILMDPHGDLSKDVMNLIPENRVNDVVYFDPSDLEYPVGFNPMEGVGSFEFRQNIVTGFVSIFKKMFGMNWNERFEHVLRYTTLALLEYPQASVLGIPRMLTDTLFRQEVISYVTDPLVKKFWATEFSSWNDQFANEAIVPIINKVGQFVANPMVRNIVGQAKSGFSLDEVMNKGKILIINLSVGKLGEDNAALLGSMFVTKIWQTAISRAFLAEEERRDTFMYVDEFQNFATTAFANILSEARKYRLNLTVAHQYMQQLPPEVSATIFGNVGNIISFRVGGEDAQILAKEFEPIFNVNDFLNLDMRNFFIKMSIDGQTTTPFSAQTITLNTSINDQTKKIIQQSRDRYAKPRTEVQKELKAWESGSVENVKKQTTHEEKDVFPEPIV